MSHAQFIVGDVFEVLERMKDGSVDLVLTSPPFLALRSYLPEGHPDKAKEIGSEPDPATFLDTLLALTAEWGRVLAPHGSLCVELGDTYAGSGGAGGDYAEGGAREGQNAFAGSQRKRVSAAKTAHRLNPDGSVKHGSERRRAEPKNQPTVLPVTGGDGWPLGKSMCLIPHAYAMSLAYGRNILTGEPSPAGMWRVRNVIAWCRPNPSVGALADKFRPATSYMVVACRERDRWFDLDAVRTPFTGNPGVGTGIRKGQNGTQSHDNRPDDLATRMNTHEGAPPLDHWWHDDDVFVQDAWKVSTESYRGSHYATWPRKLLDTPIKAMCPQRVCTTCGEPSRRLVDVTHAPNRSTNGPSSIDRRHIDGGSAGYAMRADRHVETVGWTDCGHNTWRNGIVLDPFGGSGTTAVVATGHGRDCILIDLDERNADLAAERVGMFLEITTGEPA